MTERSGGHGVVVVLPPESASIDVTGPLEAFELANFLSEQRLYRLMTATLDGSPVPVAGGFLQIVPTHSFSTLPARLGTLLVAGGPGTAVAARNRPFLAWLRSMEPRCERMGSICTASAILVAAGLVQGGAVATHWYMAPMLGANAPEIRVDADAIFLTSGKFWSSAGMTAGIDMALAMIEADHGRELALAVARFLVLAMRRVGGQSQFTAHLQIEFTGNARIREIQRWIIEQPHGDLRVATLAGRAAMSERTLQRNFKAAVGQSLGEFILAARLSRARVLLETTDLNIASVAQRSGIGSPDNLRRVFRRALGVTPTAYRDKFGPDAAV